MNHIHQHNIVNGITIVTLTNGKRVANFSSPHDFKFVDGSILPAVSNEDAEKYKIDFIENEVGDKGDIELLFNLSSDVIERMNDFADIWNNDLLDYVYIPLPMLTAIKQTHHYVNIKNSPFRCVRIEDRINKLISIDKQCI